MTDKADIDSNEPNLTNATPVSSAGEPAKTMTAAKKRRVDEAEEKKKKEDAFSEIGQSEAEKVLIRKGFETSDAIKKAEKNFEKFSETDKLLKGCFEKIKKFLNIRNLSFSKVIAEPFWKGDSRETREIEGKNVQFRFKRHLYDLHLVPSSFMQGGYQNFYDEDRRGHRRPFGYLQVQVTINDQDYFTVSESLNSEGFLHLIKDNFFDDKSLPWTKPLEDLSDTIPLEEENEKKMKEFLLGNNFFQKIQSTFGTTPPDSQNFKIRFEDPYEPNTMHSVGNYLIQEPKHSSDFWVFYPKRLQERKLEP
eukprot:GHVP01003114.1.p1 GENE.GHVP01003114.1~~GHVP01003114.1.p1  ORF type:complete len:307 (+),score=67.97 GHVP01003114.1:316-1236(+)